MPILKDITLRIILDVAAVASINEGEFFNTFSLQLCFPKVWVTHIYSRKSDLAGNGRAGPLLYWRKILYYFWEVINET